MLPHSKPHPRAGQTVRVKLAAPLLADDTTTIGFIQFKIEDWWDRISGRPWYHCIDNPACVAYGARHGRARPPLPQDSEVLYGKVDGLGHLIHQSEIAVPQIIEDNHAA